jgi:hypothetical protein
MSSREQYHVPGGDVDMGKKIYDAMGMACIVCGVPSPRDAGSRLASADNCTSVSGGLVPDSGQA